MKTNTKHGSREKRGDVERTGEWMDGRGLVGHQKLCAKQEVRERRKWGGER